VAVRHREEGEGPSSGLAWAEVSRLQKIPGKMKQAAKNVWAPQQNFEFNSMFEFKIKSFKLDLNRIQTGIIQINFLRAFQICKF
jgi:hypothetical protein